MAGGVFSTANLFGMTIRESANDGSDFTNPDADYRRLFLGEDGLLHLKDSAGTVTTPSASSGAVTTSGLTMATARLLGRTTASTGAIEEITVGSGLTLSAGSLTASGAGLGAWTSYTPTIGGVTVGNGTLVGRYKELDSATLAIHVALTWGSTSSASAADWTVSLPAGKTIASQGTQVISCYLEDAGSTYYAGVALAFAGQTYLYPLAADASAPRVVTNSAPMTRATNDVFAVSGIIELA